MTAIVLLKSGVHTDGSKGPYRHINVIAVLNMPYSTKFVTKNNRVISYENCDIDNVFLENLGK